MTVSGHTYDLDPQSVQEALQGALPEPIYEHFVVINGRRWPPKQVLALVTGLDRADFTTHQARRALTRLGFTARRSAPPTQRHAMGAATALERSAPGPMDCSPASGALRARMRAQLAPFAGIERAAGLAEEFYIGGVKTPGALARVSLTVTAGAEDFSRDAPVWLCEPW